MTPAELHREIARLIEENEKLTQLLQQRDSEIEALKARQGKEEQEWFTPPEAAAFIKRSVSFLALDRMQATPVIPFSKEGYRTIRYHRDDLEAFSNQRIRGKKAS